MHVSADTVTGDSRLTHFGPLEKDPGSQLEIDFMQLPVQTVDQRTGHLNGEPFSNRTHGLIVQSKTDQRRATYLPGVFPDLDWSNLLVSLKNKAGIAATEQVDAIAYGVLQLRITLLDLLRDGIVHYFSGLKFARFLIENQAAGAKYPLPYAVTCSTGQIHWNETDDVRNIATLAELTASAEHYPDILEDNERRSLEAAAVRILQENTASAQALSFLGWLCPRLPEAVSQRFCSKLRSRLASAEAEFEAPEIRIGLMAAGCFPSKPPERSTWESASIFGINWHLKTLEAYGEKPSPEVVAALVSRSGDILRGKDSETNFLAVAFEAMGVVSRLAPGSAEFSTNGRLAGMAFELFYELESRKARCGASVLYPFMDGTARVDITGHVHSALFFFSN
jgi:hypothetical protein